MSQRYMSKILYDAPESLRTRLQGNLPAAAAEWNAVKDRVLGTPYPPASKPGNPPHERTGKLRRQTLAIPAASTLSIQVVTTSVGKIHDREPGRRPFINLITRLAASAMQVALHRK